MSKVLGIGITTIRERCRIIHRKIGTHSRLAIRLWAIRKGMVKSYRGGVSAMKSKLPQTISYSQTHRSREVVDVQLENIEDSSEPLEGTRNRTTRSTWLLMPRPAS
jgi:hypothetical protein